MSLEETEIRSTSGAYARKAWWLPAPNSTKLCLFLDAEYYLEKMNGAATLLELQAAQSIPPVNVLFVSHANGEARLADYICNVEYSRFIVEDVVDWARARAPHLRADHHTICGLSLSGLAATFLSLINPLLFSHVLCQSGSFWWNDEWLLHQVPTLFTKPSRLWLSVGDKERESGILHVNLFQGVPQIDAVERMAAALTQRGCEVNHQLFHGGHEFSPWKEELPSALSWLYRSSSR